MSCSTTPTLGVPGYCLCAIRTKLYSSSC